MSEINNDDLKSLQESVAQLQQGYQTMVEENKALREQLSAKAQSAPAEEKAVVPKLTDKTFTVGKKTYKFVAPVFRIGADTVTHVDALGDKDILQQLVDMGSEVIKEVSA